MLVDDVVNHQRPTQHGPDRLARPADDGWWQAQSDSAAVLARAGVLDHTTAASVLEATCASLHAAAGELWCVDGQADLLRRTGHFATPSAPGALRVDHMPAIERGVGLPGRVWASGASESQHAPPGALGVPITLRGEVLGVIVLYGGATGSARDWEPPVQAIAHHLAQFIGRLRAEAALRDIARRPGTPPTPEAASLDDLRERIRGRMGVCPSFFELATADPPIAHALFDLATSAYLDSPLPPRFKETLFTYLSRFCPVRYCLARHAGFLLGRGHVAGDPAVPPLSVDEVAALVASPIPDARELPALLRELEEHAAPLPDWPAFDTRLGSLVRVACSMVFVNPQRATRWNAGLRRLFGPQRHEQVMLFLAFVRLAHFWTEVHPALAIDEDVLALLAEHESLARPLLTDSADAARLAFGEQVQQELLALREAATLSKALRRSEARYRDLYDHAPDMYCSVDAGTGIVLECNQTLLDKTGFSVAEIVGRPLLDRYDPEVLDEARACLDTFRATGAVAYAELRIRRRDAAPLDVSLSVSAVRDEQGRIIASRSVWRDLTERKLAERALRHSEERFRRIFDHAATAIAITDWDGRFEKCNPAYCALVGYTEEELHHLEFGALVHPEDRTANMADLARLRAGHVRMFEIENRYIQKSGDVVWVRKLVSVLPDQAGRQAHMVALVTDITERRRAEEALRENDRRKDEFLATLAHELRNPLAPLRTGLQLVRVARNAGDTAERALQAMERQVQHMVRLIDDLLDMSRINQGKIGISRERLAIASVVQHAAETSRAAIEQGGHRLTLHLPPEPVHVEGDAVRLAQIFGNLLQNAAKFTPRDGHIVLTVRRDDPDVVVSVRDNGVGIPAAMLERVFDMFVQVGGSAEGTQGGLGIGLWLVKQLVQLHRGSIEARSEGPDRGSEFLVRLPMVPPDAELEARGQAAPPSSARLRILVVDDNRDAASTLADMLTFMGHDARATFDGVSALDVGGTFDPELVLLDLGMPELDGFEVARRMRAEAWGRVATIAALTGWGQDQDRRRSREAGFDHHFVKPVEPVALERLIAGVRPSPT